MGGKGKSRSRNGKWNQYKSLSIVGQVLPSQWVHLKISFEFSSSQHEQGSLTIYSNMNVQHEQNPPWESQVIHPVPTAQENVDCSYADLREGDRSFQDVALPCSLWWDGSSAPHLSSSRKVWRVRRTFLLKASPSTSNHIPLARWEWVFGEQLAMSSPFN